MKLNIRISISTPFYFRLKNDIVGGTNTRYLRLYLFILATFLPKDFGDLMIRTFRSSGRQRSAADWLFLIQSDRAVPLGKMLLFFYQLRMSKVQV